MEIVNSVNILKSVFEGYPALWIAFLNSIIRSLRYEVVFMKILECDHRNSKDLVIIRALTGDAEYRQLQGHSEQICLFASSLINLPIKTVKTGARHNYAKWFLVPVKLRSRFSADEYDYNNVKAGSIEYRDNVFFIFNVLKKGVTCIREKV